MPLCSDCKNKTCLITKKPCPLVEKLLSQPTDGRMKGEFPLCGVIMGDRFYKDREGDIVQAPPPKKKYRE